MLKGIIDMFILFVLIDEDSYGYAIAQKIKERSNQEFMILEGTLYTALKRLEKSGAIFSYSSEESKGAKRKYYSITEEGKVQLKTLVEEWSRMSLLIERFNSGCQKF